MIPWLAISSIRSGFNTTLVLSKVLRLSWSPSSSSMCFNTILVLSKRRLLAVLHDRWKPFQYHPGSIKVWTADGKPNWLPELTFMFQFHFDAIQSPASTWPITKALESFNSTLVLLKGIDLEDLTLRAIHISIPLWFHQNTLQASAAKTATFKF